TPARTEVPMSNPKISLAAFAAAVQISSAAFAATWTGASNGFPFPPNNNWSNPGNWAGLAIPASSGGTDVIFGQSSRLSPLQDLGDGFVIHNLVFTTAGYNLSGFSIAPPAIFNDAPSLLLPN